MIGQIITDTKTGEPLDANGKKLSKSDYQPSEEVKKLFAKVQTDFQVAWALQHTTLEEFDGHSLLERTRLDQETFAAYVGCEYVPKQKAWRWKGRKNTARNKLIKILARAIAGMLYPFVDAKNDRNEEDKMTARVMRILIEDHLKKAGYKMKFLYMVLSALVNPAVFVEVEYVEMMQRIKRKMQDGRIEILEIVDELLSGLALNILPIDEILLSDFWSGTGKIQNLTYILRVQRIPWDVARARYAGKYFDSEGTDLFIYVEAGQTKIVVTGADTNATLFDVQWTEADKNFVQVITAKYRSEDLEVTWVGGVGMFNEKDCYNTNPFTHRRMVLAMIDGKQEWVSIPVYNLAMSGFEPIDPVGRFAFYKSGAFKEYWDDKWLNAMDEFLYNGTALEVGKPIFMSGVGKVDSTVMAPYATVGMPAGANVSAFSVSPNLAATYQAVQMAKDDLGDSMNAEAVDTSSQGNKKAPVSATQIDATVAQVKLFFTCFSLMLADLVEQVGSLTMDCTIQNTTVGEIDYAVPEALKMKYKEILSKGREKGREVTNHIVFTDKHTRSEGKPMLKGEKDMLETKMYMENGMDSPDKYLYEVNPYQFARNTYTMRVDADQIVIKSLGQDKANKVNDFNVMTDPRIAPFTDPQAVANEMIEEFSFGDDPEKFKKKGDPMQQMGMLSPIQSGTPQPSPGAAALTLQ